MAELYFEKEEVKVVTNTENTMEKHLVKSLDSADRVDIIVSFVMESGVRILLTDLKSIVQKGVKVRILTGDYLGITEPGALYLLKGELGGNLDLRMYNDKRRSFHPKTYIFHKRKDSELYIGSSNLSISALTDGVEWNYRLSESVDKESFDEFVKEFENLFYNHSIIVDDEVLREYSRNWKRPLIIGELEKNEKKTREYVPRGAQIEALYALKATREEGADKALIHAATGVGKTYLAAFDSLSFKRVLFVAHREEILRQAYESFRNVRNEEDFGFFNSKIKDCDRNVVFASVYSLGRKNYLNEKFYSPTYFDYIIIDEFHHAVANLYMNILEYFKPKFLLGLTATPERMDGRSIYALCDYNVPYEIGLKDAINKGYLVPFRYYGIYDDTVDYSTIRIANGRYVAEELEDKLLVERRYDLIYGHYKKHNSIRAMGFCSTRKHAEEMAKQFNKRGTASVAVYSNGNGEYSEDRYAAMEKLEKGEISVVFSVDMFNEGVDICSIDMVMFLRPTESPVVFLQQLGRGLRKSEGKEYLTVLDFIGNYALCGKVPFLLSGQKYDKEIALTGLVEHKLEYPQGCFVNFDLKIIDLFREMSRREIGIEDRIILEYERVKGLTGRDKLSRMEFFTNMDGDVYTLCMNNSKVNPFRDFLAFLDKMGELGEEEKMLVSGIGKEFLNTLETTSMTKSYKMPILLAFYNDGNTKMDLTEDDVYKSYKSFYEKGTRWVDLARDKRTRDFTAWNKDRYIKEALRNPIFYLIKSGNGFFAEKEGYLISLNSQLEELTTLQAFAKHMKDIIDYRTADYFRKRYDKNS